MCYPVIAAWLSAPGSLEGGKFPGCELHNAGVAPPLKISKNSTATTAYMGYSGPRQVRKLP